MTFKESPRGESAASLNLNEAIDKTLNVSGNQFIKLNKN